MLHYKWTWLIVRFVLACWMTTQRSAWKCWQSDGQSSNSNSNNNFNTVNCHWKRFTFFRCFGIENKWYQAQVLWKRVRYVVFSVTVLRFSLCKSFELLLQVPNLKVAQYGFYYFPSSKQVGKYRCFWEFFAFLFVCN